jgi:N-acyl-D-aspartate/D-glutamate deacylase
MLVHYSPSRPDMVGRRLVDVARERREHPSEVMLDLCVETDLEARFGVETSFSTVHHKQQELFEHAPVRFGLSDAGAHMSQLCDARYPTHVLGYWVRQRGMPLERAVQMLTSLEADAFGILDRGRLVPGAAADVCVFDPETVTDGPVRRVDDLPGGARRLVATPNGIEQVIVNGVVIREHNQDTVDPEGDLPGMVLRRFGRYGQERQC